MKSSRPKADEDLHRAMEAWEAGNLDLAFSLLSSCARRGDTHAQLTLGVFYDEELKKPQQGFYWYHKAYKSGLSPAAACIALFHREHGEAKKAVWWFRKALAMGNDDVLVQLGKCYLTGYGVKKSLSKARTFYQRAMTCGTVCMADEEEAEDKLKEIDKLEKRQKRQKR